MKKPMLMFAILALGLSQARGQAFMDPMKAMFIPSPYIDYSGYTSTDPAIIANAYKNNLATLARFDFNQFPRGIKGLKPVGTYEGIPVYNDMPVYSEVDGAFIAMIQWPGLDYRLPGPPRWVLFPAKGKKREKQIEKLRAEYEQALLAQQQYAFEHYEEWESEKAATDAAAAVSHAKAKAAAEATRQKIEDSNIRRRVPHYR